MLLKFCEHTAQHTIHIICRGARMNVPFIHKCSTNEEAKKKNSQWLKKKKCRKSLLETTKEKWNAFGDMVVTISRFSSF